MSKVSIYIYVYIYRLRVKIALWFLVMALRYSLQLLALEAMYFQGCKKIIMKMDDIDDMGCMYDVIWSTNACHFLRNCSNPSEEKSLTMIKS